MKWRILALYVLLGSVFLPDLQGQVAEAPKVMSLGEQNAMSLELPNVEHIYVEKLWMKYMNSFGGLTKKMKRSEEWHTRNATIDQLGSGESLNLYTQVGKLGNRAALYLWVKLDEAFISSRQHPEQYKAVEKLLIRFGLYVAKESTLVRLEEEEQGLKRLKANLKKLERDDERYQREIEQARKRIKLAEESLQQNATEQEQTRKLIQLQQQAIEVVKRKLDGLQ